MKSSWVMSSVLVFGCSWLLLPSCSEADPAPAGNAGSGGGAGTTPATAGSGGSAATTGGAGGSPSTAGSAGSNTTTGGTAGDGEGGNTSTAGTGGSPPATGGMPPIPEDLETYCNEYCECMFRTRPPHPDTCNRNSERCREKCLPHHTWDDEDACDFDCQDEDGCARPEGCSIKPCLDECMADGSTWDRACRLDKCRIADTDYQDQMFGDCAAAQGRNACFNLE